MGLVADSKGGDQAGLVPELGGTPAETAGQTVTADAIGQTVAAGAAHGEAADGFSVSLDVYQGPFEVLLSLIAQRRLEVTQLALSEITGEFIAYVSAMDLTTQADEASEFLVVASVLVEAKSAALLPSEEGQALDEQSLESLRERDLLFARLLQYKAFKQAAEDLRERLARNSGRFDHHPELSADLRARLHQVEWTLSAYDFALLAAKVFANAPAQTVSLRQLHVPLADLRAESLVVRDRLLAAGGRPVTFAELIADQPSRVQVVARFLSVLAFFKLEFIQFKQAGAFAPLSLRWVASEEDFEARGGALTATGFW